MSLRNPLTAGPVTAFHLSTITGIAGPPGPPGSGTPFAAGGDLGGTPTSQTVIGIKGQTLPALSTGYLNWTGGTWALNAIPVGFTAAGDLAGSPTTQEVVGLLSHALPGSVPGSNSVLAYNGGAWAFQLPGSIFTPGGDLGGSAVSQTVVGIFSKGLPALPVVDSYLHYTGSAWAYSPISAGSTPGGDLTGTASQQWVTTISGRNGLGGDVVINAASLQFALDSDGTFGQEPTGQALGQSMNFGMQPGVNANFSPGNLYFTLAAANGSGVDGAFQICYGTPEIPLFRVGPSPSFGRGWLSVWMAGPDVGLLPNGNNQTILMSNLGNVIVNSGYAFFGGGNIQFIFGNNFSANPVTFSESGQLFNGGTGLAGGNGVMAIGAATTPATQGALPTTCGIFQSVGLVGMQWLAPPITGGLGQKAFTTTIGPACAAGAWNTHAMLRPQPLAIGTTTSNGTVVQTVTPPVIATVGCAARFKTEIVGKTVAAGATGALGDMCSFWITGSYRNIGGTLTLVGTPQNAVPPNMDTSHVGATVGVSASGATYLVTVTGATNAGAQVDWEILTEELTV